LILLNEGMVSRLDTWSGMRPLGWLLPLPGSILNSCGCYLSYGKDRDSSHLTYGTISSKLFTGSLIAKFLEHLDLPFILIRPATDVAGRCYLFSYVG